MYTMMERRLKLDEVLNEVLLNVRIGRNAKESFLDCLTDRAREHYRVLRDAEFRERLERECG